MTLISQLIKSHIRSWNCLVWKLARIKKHLGSVGLRIRHIIISMIIQSGRYLIALCKISTCSNTLTYNIETKLTHLYYWMSFKIYDLAEIFITYMGLTWYHKVRWRKIVRCRSHHWRCHQRRVIWWTGSIWWRLWIF